MTICLITPPSVFLLDERVFLTLGILKVAAVLERYGHIVEMLDTSGIEGFEKAVADHATNTEAKLFGITATTPQMPAVTKIVEVLRQVRPDARIILGGPHITLICAALKREKKIGMQGRATRAYAKLEAMFDTLVAGDGEDAIFVALNPNCDKLIDADKPSGPLFLTNEKLNELPWPARHLVDVDSYHYSIEGRNSLSVVGQLGCPFASLTGDTLISTQHGFERLDSLITGKGRRSTCVHGATIEVYDLQRTITTHKGVAQATKIINEGTRSLLELKTENGIRLRGTPEHPFLTLVNGKPEWKKLKDLKKWDYLILKTPEHEWPTEPVRLKPATYPKIPPGGFKRKKYLKAPETLTEDVAWLTGFIIGDGCLPKDGRPSVHVCVTPSVDKRLRKLSQKLFNARLSVRPSSLTKKMKHGWIHSRAAYNFFAQSIGINPHDKFHVPETIRRSPRPMVEAFLRGLFDADGYSQPGAHEYLVTKSETLAREVAALILMLGEVPNVNHPRDDSFRVGRFHNDRIPTEFALYKSLKSGKWHWRNPRQLRSFCGVRRRTLKVSGLKHPLDRPGWHYVRVESVRRCGNGVVYDLHVPHHHSFLADGLISHNCGFCGGRESPMLRRIRTRSVENIVQEVVFLHRTYGITGVQWYDDELNVSKEMIPLMDKLAATQQELGVEFRQRGFIKSQLFTDAQAEAMYRAGFRWILVGFESGSERILENINKKANRSENTRCMEIAKRHGLKVKALMSMGHPGESEETIQATKDWLLEVQPDDFDMTVITTYPGTAYFDWAVETEPGVWTYTYPKTGDRLHAHEVDFNLNAEYYKGRPGEYQSFVWTDYLTPEQLVKLRDGLEAEVRQRLNIPFNQSAASLRYEHSMGQLPPFILKSTTERLIGE